MKTEKQIKDRLKQLYKALEMTHTIKRMTKKEETKTDLEKQLETSIKNMRWVLK